MSTRAKIDGTEGFDARGFANFILDEFDAEEHEISNLKLNKLIFFAHGFYSARFGKRLVRNHIEAWDNGPVVRVVFDAFKQNGKNPISNRAVVFDYLNNTSVLACLDRIPDHHLSYLRNVISHYADYSAGHLVYLTHLPGSPWHRARTSSSDHSRVMDRIPEEWIRDFFVENFGRGAEN